MVFAEMPLSSKHWVVGSDATLGRAHAGLAVRADDLERRRLLVDGGAGGARRASEAERVVQRMQVPGIAVVRSEEHTSELQSLMRISYAVFCLKKKKHTQQRLDSA